MTRAKRVIEKSINIVLSFLYKNTNKTKGERNMHKHEKLTKREKVVIIGAAVVTTCIAGYFGIKWFGLHKDLERLAEQSMSLEDSMETLRAAMEETGRI